MEILNFKGPLSDLIHILKKGGSIHIKKKNRGKFTDYCGGKVTEECIAKGKKSKDPKIRKRATFAANARKWKHEDGGVIRFQPGGTVKLDDYGYPADVTPAIVTQDSEFNKFLTTLPDNLRLTPEKDYHMYTYWKLSGKPENFKEGKRRGMFTWDDSDKGYHAGSIAEDRNTGIYHFMKPKHHPTVKYELDWFNKGLQTLEGGKQVPVEGRDKEFWEDFTSKYQLDTTGVDYQYVPIKKKGGILKAQEGAGNWWMPQPLSPVGIALNQAKTRAKRNGTSEPLPAGVKEVVGLDGQKIAIRTEQPLQPMGQEVAAWLPGVGDVVEIGQIANDVKNGNLGTAALAAGLMVLPGNARKILDKFGVDLGDISTFARLSDQEWDDMYFQAIESGDNDLVQHIRDAHFKVKAPDTKAIDSEGNPIRLFHGEKDSPKYHDLRYLNSGPNHQGLGVYYSSTSKDIAKTYAQHKGGPTGQVREVYYNMKNPNVVDAEGRSFQTVLIEEGAFGSRTGVSTDQLVNRTYWDRTPEGYNKKSDKDGLIIQNVEDHAPGWTRSSEDAIADNYVTWNPYAVKSAEAIVRHPDTGEIIPISKRDNFKIPSILMGTAPMIFGLNAISNNKNNKE